MTELEATDLKVGDMVLYYSPGAAEPHAYVEEVQGKTYGVDMGLVLKNDGTHVHIDWFSEDEGPCGFEIGSAVLWRLVEKV